MSSEAWVVACTGCKCVINCFAIDPQLEHGKAEREIAPPAPSAVVTCPCCGGAYRYSGPAIARGTPRRSPMCHRRQQAQDSVATQRNEVPGKIIYLGACLIAAVRLAREEKWDNSPRVASRIGDSVQLAYRVWERMKKEFPGNP